MNTSTVKKTKSKLIPRQCMDDLPDYTEVIKADIVTEADVNILAELDKPQEADVESLIQAIDDDMLRFRRGGLPTEQDFKRAFEASLSYENYIRIFKERMVVGASTYVPGAINAVGRSAIAGDIKAAKLLFTIVDLPTKEKSPQVVTNVQVNIPTIKELLSQVTDSEEIIDV